MTRATAVEGAAIVLLSVAIMVIPAPARALRKIVFQHVIYDGDRINNHRIGGIAHAEPDQLEKIGADDIARRMQAAAIGNLNHGFVRADEIPRALRIGWRDADIVPRFSRGQLAFAGNGPLFEMRGEP